MKVVINFLCSWIDVIDTGAVRAPSTLLSVNSLGSALCVVVVCLSVMMMTMMMMMIKLRDLRITI